MISCGPFQFKLLCHSACLHRTKCKTYSQVFAVRGQSWRTQRGRVKHPLLSAAVRQINQRIRIHSRAYCDGPSTRPRWGQNMEGQQLPPVQSSVATMGLNIAQCVSESGF